MYFLSYFLVSYHESFVFLISEQVHHIWTKSFEYKFIIKLKTDNRRRHEPSTDAESRPEEKAKREHNAEPNDNHIQDTPICVRHQNNNIDTSFGFNCHTRFVKDIHKSVTKYLKNLRYRNTFDTALYRVPHKISYRGTSSSN